MACLSILINRGFIIGDPAALPSKRKVCSVFCFVSHSALVLVCRESVVKFPQIVVIIAN